MQPNIYGFGWIIRVGLVDFFLCLRNGVEFGLRNLGSNKLGLVHERWPCSSVDRHLAVVHDSAENLKSQL